ncbi:MAG: hypothetical protein ACI857_001703 [Arenicella sp.]|jgi:hypothetical protein
MHDPPIGRFFAVDPLTAKYPHNSPYAFSENIVIHTIELEGLEAFFIHGTGCVDTYDVTVNSQLGIVNEALDLNWSIFPNPSEADFTVKLDKGIDADAQIEVRDVQGRIIYQSSAKAIQSIRIKEAGVYLVVVTSTQGKSVKRIVIQ